MSLDIKCTFEHCTYSSFCTRFTLDKESIKTYFAMRPPVNDEFKCVMFDPNSGLAKRIYKQSQTPLASDVEVIAP
jgi:hypothetical protein